MVLLTSMITTGMYWVRQLSAEHMQIHHFIKAQQEREVLLNALTYSIPHLMKQLHGEQLKVPWEHTTQYEDVTIMYQTRTKNTVAVVFYHNRTNHSLRAELYLEYLSNNKKRCTLHMIP